MKRPALALALGLAPVALAACVPDSATWQLKPGKYADYHALSRSLGETAVEKQNAPQDVKDRFADCLADYTTKAFTPAELQRLDAYARGEIPLTNGELKHLDAVSNDRMNGSKLTNATVDRFETTCPQDVPDFRRYLNFDS